MRLDSGAAANLPADHGCINNQASPRYFLCETLPSIVDCKSGVPIKASPSLQQARPAESVPPDPRYRHARAEPPQCHHGRRICLFQIGSPP